MKNNLHIIVYNNKIWQSLKDCIINPLLTLIENIRSGWIKIWIRHRPKKKKRKLRASIIIMNIREEQSNSNTGTYDKHLWRKFKSEHHSSHSKLFWIVSLTDKFELAVVRHLVLMWHCEFFLFISSFQRIDEWIREVIISL